jgi:hypothetical protein
VIKFSNSNSKIAESATPLSRQKERSYTRTDKVNLGFSLDWEDIEHPAQKSPEAP